MLALLFSVYFAFPARNHYWDGIGFALNIEGVPQDHIGHQPEFHATGWPGGQHGDGAIYYNPNHLLYNAAGRALYVTAKAAWPQVRALDVLVWWSIASSLLTSCLVFLLTLRFTGRVRASFWITLLFASTATWWKFSTDANAYVPSTALLVCCAWLLSDRQKPPVAAIAALHAGAMLLHQIAIWFYPAVWVALWMHRSWVIRGRAEKDAAGGNRAGRATALAAYSALSAGLVTAAYLAVWFGALERPWDLRAFASWITFNGGDVLDRQPFGAHLLHLWRGTLRVFVGGKLSLAWQYTPLAVWVPAGALAAFALVSLLRSAWNQLGSLSKASARLPKSAEVTEVPEVPVPESTVALVPEGGAAAARMPAARISSAPRSAMPRALPRGALFLAAWLGAFALFLCVWLTEYPYYRLFCLPGLFILAAALGRRHLPRRLDLRHPLPACALLLAVLNFVLYIYPHSRPEASPPLQVALAARDNWPPSAVVYFADFNCDNWWLKYFNMHTRWRRPSKDPRLLLTELRSALRNGDRVYLDTGMLQRLEDPRLRTALDHEFVWPDSFGISTAKHNIRFAEIRWRESAEKMTPSEREIRFPQ